jgi:hypothetical protein
MNTRRDAGVNSTDQTTWTSTAGSPTHAAPPIDDPAQPPVAHDAVAVDVAVDPHGRAAMRRSGERFLPHGEGCPGVDVMSRTFDRGAG